MTNIVVVGGGAGGLELATSLGRKLGKKNKAKITLVDRNRTHLWKPCCTKWPPAPWTRASTP